MKHAPLIVLAVVLTVLFLLGCNQTETVRFNALYISPAQNKGDTTVIRYMEKEMEVPMDVKEDPVAFKKLQDQIRKEFDVQAEVPIYLPDQGQTPATNAK